MININKLKYLPNWVVLLLDILIVIFSGIITLYIFKELELNYILLTHFYSIFFFYLSVNIFFFLALRTYSGIIRHTSQIDAIKLFLSQFLTFGIIVFIDYFLLYIGKPKIAILTASLFSTPKGIIIKTVFGLNFNFLISCRDGKSRVTGL
jgi:FlaA1/EpsC-like NDP-sugar epimerase